MTVWQRGLVVKRSRREFIGLIGGVGVAAAVGRPHGRARAQQAAPGARRHGAARRLELISGAGSNVVARAHEGAPLLVDSGAPEHAPGSQAVRRAVRRPRPSRCCSTRIGTSTTRGGNEALRGERDTTIVAHEITRLWMSTEFYVDWEDRTYTPRAASRLSDQDLLRARSAAARARASAARQVEYGHLPEAHTDGDIYVLFQERNVLVAGGVVTAGAYPVLDYTTGGWIGGLVDATTEAARMMRRRHADRARRRARATARRSRGAAHDAADVRERIEAITLQGRSIEDMLASRITEGIRRALWQATRRCSSPTSMTACGGVGCAGSVT